MLEDRLLTPPAEGGLSGGRYWWFRFAGTQYFPPVFSFLTQAEQEVLEGWFNETDRISAAGECNVPPISVLHGFIMGSGIRNIVQLGHFYGYSTLLIGFMMRHMGFRHSLLTIDIDPKASAFVAEWLKIAGLEDYVKIIVSDSSAPELPELAREYFDADVRAVFVDSSHQYQHTVSELDLWYPALRPGGLLFLHDVSPFAAEFDPTHGGGVHRAVTEWIRKNQTPGVLLNSDFPVRGPAEALVYLDGCGLGILQKPFRSISIHTDQID